MSTSLREWSTYAELSDTPLTEADKAYFRARTRRQIHGEVLDRFEDLRELGMLNRSALARRLGVDRSYVTRLLASPSNWTIDTLSDLLLAMACQASLRADAICTGQSGNYSHPWSGLGRDNQMPPSGAPRSSVSTDDDFVEVSGPSSPAYRTPTKTESLAA